MRKSPGRVVRQVCDDAKEMDRAVIMRPEEKRKKSYEPMLCAALSGHILFLSLISFYGGFAQAAGDNVDGFDNNKSHGNDL